MKRQHQTIEGGQNIELISYFDYNNNLIDRVSGSDMNGITWSMYATVEFATDPTDSSRKVLCRPTSGSKGLQGPFILKEGKYYGYYVSGNSNDVILLVGKTVEFYWYPKSNSSSRAYIWENVDVGGGISAKNLGCDLYRDNNTLKIVARWNNGSVQQQTYTWCTFSVNKWYRVVIDYIDNGTSFRYFYQLFDGDNLVADSSNLSLPDITTSPSLSYCDRISCFLNSHYGYYASWANNTDYIKEFKVYKKTSTI